MASNDEYQQQRSFKVKKKVSLMVELAEYCEKFTNDCDVFWLEKYNKSLLKSEEEYITNKTKYI